MHENDLFNMFPEFLNVVRILAVTAAEQPFSVLRRLKTYPHSTMGQQRVINIALINIERVYANSVVNNDIDHITDIFGRQNGRELFLLICFMSSYDRFICKKILLHT